MENTQIHRHKILIADDSEINRTILVDMLEGEYDFLEAEDGEQAIKIIEDNPDLSLILLDMIMPKKDGMCVLEYMNESGFIDEIPVVMISAERTATNIEKAYDLGAADFISRPFDSRIVRRRVVNTIILYAKQKKLTQLVIHQFYEKERKSNLMIEILSHIVEFRNGESGQHVRNVHHLTELLLKKLRLKIDKYSFSSSEISTISTASALHDIGKIAISESILNKPGKLTEEEFSQMKKHSMIGAEILENMSINESDDLVQTAYKICRWHHERYDGNGYPDRLKGDEIPICAQVVSLADVYDALTSDRVYKKAIPSAQAIKMICNGECGVFNPELLECLKDLESTLLVKDEIEDTANDFVITKSLIDEMLAREETAMTKHKLKLFEQERMKYDFFSSLTNEIQFEFSALSSSIAFSPFGANILGLPQRMNNPFKNTKVLSVIQEKDLTALCKLVKSTCADLPDVTYDCILNIGNEKRWYCIVLKAIWSSEYPSQYMGVIGKAFDVNASRKMLNDLQIKASSDALTGLLNHASAKNEIIDRLAQKPDRKFVLAIFDLDSFKSANDLYGHLFGDKVLAHTGKKLCQSVRDEDIIARVGGDEFLIFFEYKSHPELVIDRIFSSLCGSIDDFKITLSMGVATTDVIGMDYYTLFSAADKALYSVKRSNGGKYCFYDDSMKEMFSIVSPIATKSE